MRKQALVGLLTGVVMLSGCGHKNIDTQIAIDTTDSSTPIVTTSTPIPTDTEVPTDGIPLTVQWQKAQTSTSLGLMHVEKENTSTMGFSSYEEITSYYKVGSLTFNNVSSDLYFMNAEAADMGGGGLYYFVKNVGGITLLAKNSTSLYESINPESSYSDGLNRKKFAINTTSTLADLQFPKTLQFKNPRQKVQYLNYNLASYFTESIKGSPAVIDKDGHKLYSDARGGFLLPNQTNMVAVYRYVPDIYADTTGLGTPLVTWNDGTKLTDEYSSVTYGGCGSSNYISVVDLSIKNDLVAAGKTNMGDVVYLPKDTHNSRLTKMYDQSYDPSASSTDGKVPYETFVAARPVFYWVDPFGRLIEFKNDRFAPQAECGKPVIYLYPTSTMNVKVQLQPQGGFTYTEPDYRLYWYMKAQPNGHLTDLYTNKEYPYIYWEGRGGIYEQPTKGFVVKREAIKGFLPAKLHQLGLNDQETNDFMEFWLPRMQEKPYYFITFMGNKKMDELAPMTVTPAPTTIIRVLMDFTPLDAWKKVEALKLPPKPKRTGFTVIEWGGVLR